MQFNPAVGIFLLKLDILDMVLTPLGHHVLVIELLVYGLVNQACLADSGFSRNDDSGSQD